MAAGTCGPRSRAKSVDTAIAALIGPDNNAYTPGSTQAGASGYWFSAGGVHLLFEPKGLRLA